MRILALYLTREFLKLFLLLVISFVAIYLLFDFIEKVDNFHEAGVPSATMLSYFVLKIPEIVNQLMPMAMLLATVVTLGLMGRKNEIVAIKSNGVSILRFTLPLILLALVLTGALAMLRESVLPHTMARSNYIWDVLVEKRPRQLYHKEKFWHKGQNSIYHVGFFDQSTNTLSKVTYYRFDKAFNLVFRIDARRARFLGGAWFFFAGMAQMRDEEGRFVTEKFTEKRIVLPEMPSDFARLAKPSDEMTLVELKEYLHKIEREGYDARRYRVDLQARIAYPFVCLILALIGIPLALLKERGRFMAPAVVIGMASAVIYWISFSYTRSIFGYAGVLPPFMAVWLPNAIFGLAGLWMLTSVRQ